MFLVNGKKATLTKYNRNGTTGVWDDSYTSTTDIILCPYNQDIRVSFGEYTRAEAIGYFTIKNTTDIKEGDQITYGGSTYTILEVKDNWLWNKVANYSVAVK